MLRITTLLGLLLGFACVIFGISYYTKDFTVYLNLPGLLVVLGGLIGALLLSYRATVIFRITRSIRKAFFRHTELPREIASRFVEYAKLLSERGISALEEEAAKLPKNSVERLALELVIAGYKPQDIERIIEDEIRTKQVINEVDAEVFETLAKYAPSFGMLGTVVGLIAMLKQLSEDISQLGPNMALALTTTLYGVLLSATLFGPMAEKVRRLGEDEIVNYEIIRRGAALLAERRNPVYVRDALNAFLVERAKLGTEAKGGESK